MMSGGSQFNSAPEEPLALVGVAIGNNIGTDIPRSETIPVDLPPDVVSVQNDLLRSGVLDDWFFGEHFTRIQAYEEVANIGILEYLKSHEDRAEALDRYVSILQNKTTEAQSVVANLVVFRDFHANSFTSLAETINAKQASIEAHYRNRDGESIEQGLIDLEELRITSNDHRQASIFANNFIQEYTALITASNNKLAILNSNKDPLVKGVTILLPPGATLDNLRDLHLFNNPSEE
jgi:hypothetical protein